jgi:hypothetical protein
VGIEEWTRGKRERAENKQRKWEEENSKGGDKERLSFPGA